ncbi:MAG: citramalate synthase [Firmicutes bacterium]|nr:citramalate synthase [Bacillota bacterium]
MTKQIFLYDTTLRDGSQGEGISFSSEDKIRIAKRLDAFGVHYIEGGWPGSNPKDIAFFKEAAKLTWKNATITAFGSTRRPGLTAAEDKNLAAILDSGVRVATIFGKSWDFHVTDALRTTLEENLSMIRESIEFLRAHGLTVFYDAEHFFDGYKANPEYALETVSTAAQAGAAYIILCDTNGGTLPSEVSQIVRVVKGVVGVPLGIHAHNDSGLAVANTLMAVEAGAVQVQGTVNGIGERAGNADLCAVIPNLQLKMGKSCVTPEQLATLTKLSRFVSELANMQPVPSQPFVGRSVFAHKGGVHVSALRRHPETYEHIPPELVGNTRRVLVSELSGSANIMYKLEEYDLQPAEPFAPQRLVNIIKEMENQGYYFEGAEASFEILLKKALGLHQQLFELIGFRLIIEKHNSEDAPVAEASIKLKVGDQIIHTVADGNGPVNALDAALRKALGEVYPQINHMKLSDYKVRVLDERSGTGAKVRVLIETTDNGRSWGTVGVSTDIIEASWRALSDSIDYGLRLRADANNSVINSE